MDEIKKILQLYFDASYQGSPEMMAQVFHEAAHIYSYRPDGSLVDMDKAAFVALISPSNSDVPTERRDEVISIDLASDYTAVARVALRVGSTQFSDILNFIKIDGKWGVISKLYSGTSVK